MKIKAITLTLSCLMLSLDSYSADIHSNGNGEFSEFSLVQNQEQYSQYIDRKMAKISDIRQFASQPPRPDPIEDKSTIPGVDSDQNGLRDSLERVLYQNLTFIPNLTKEQYDTVMGLAKKMSPSDPVVPDSILELDVYCDYQTLSDSIQHELSFSSLELLVNNTPERMIAYEESIVRMDGTIFCDNAY